jgi:D-mannose binding lectin/S-locus glycoprotein domain/PAN domain
MYIMRSTNFFVCYILALLMVRCTAANSSIHTRIAKGFTASPTRSNAQFEPLLTDVIGVFAFGFLRIGSAKLDLAIIHQPSMQQVWRANPLNLPNWDNSTMLSFDGNLVLTDETVQAGTIWTSKYAGGDYVTLSNNSNLQIYTSDGGDSPLWQSFDYPFDTLVQGQKFSSATIASLVTADKQYTLRIGIAYLALFMQFQEGQELNYWKHTALKATALKDIYAQVDPRGFLGLYYVRDGTSVDRIPFDSFERGYLGFHRLTLQSDGNLYAYYWDNDRWALVYTAQTESCGLPGICGAYGICIPGSPPQCSCLVNGTDGCLQTDSGDFCGGQNSGFSVVRTSGVTVEYTDIMEIISVDSLNECEKTCEQSCVCWGALYANTAKNCYIMDYPIQTVEKSGSAYKGYFKLRSNDQGPAVHGRKHRDKPGHRAVIAVVVILTLVFACMAAYGGYWWWDKRRNSLPVIQLGMPQNMKS